MDDEDFNGVVAGLNDAIAYAKSDKSRGRRAAVDAKAVRANTELGQGKSREPTTLDQ